MVYVSSTYHDRAGDIALKRRQPDLSRHLSAEARARLPNPIKAIWKVAQVKPGTINMGNGDPHHTLYPVTEMNFVVPSVREQDPVQTWRAGTGEQQIISSHKDEALRVEPQNRHGLTAPVRG
ncbi:hypothetical protein J3R82DRAFT_7552 [Butyriboletus roseoflavus]|nr:hypothetical protein J3R82DRAFT_7552 [Butyriboletus roseoflavus]